MASPFSIRPPGKTNWPGMNFKSGCRLPIRSFGIRFFLSMTIRVAASDGRIRGFDCGGTAALVRGSVTESIHCGRFTICREAFLCERSRGAESMHSEGELQTDDGAFDRLEKRQAQRQSQRRPDGDLNRKRHLEARLGDENAIADHVP